MTSTATTTTLCWQQLAFATLYRLSTEAVGRVLRRIDEVEECSTATWKFDNDQHMFHIHCPVSEVQSATSNLRRIILALVDEEDGKVNFDNDYNPKVQLLPQALTLENYHFDVSDFVEDRPVLNQDMHSNITSEKAITQDVDGSNKRFVESLWTPNTNDLDANFFTSLPIEELVKLSHCRFKVYEDRKQIGLSGADYNLLDAKDRLEVIEREYTRKPYIDHLVVVHESKAFELRLKTLNKLQDSRFERTLTPPYWWPVDSEPNIKRLSLACVITHWSFNVYRQAFEEIEGSSRATTSLSEGAEQLMDVSFREVGEDPPRPFEHLRPHVLDVEHGVGAADMDSSINRWVEGIESPSSSPERDQAATQPNIAAGTEKLETRQLPLPASFPSSQASVSSVHSVEQINSGSRSVRTPAKQPIQRFVNSQTPEPIRRGSLANESNNIENQSEPTGSYNQSQNPGQQSHQFTVVRTPKRGDEQVAQGHPSNRSRGQGRDRGRGRGQNRGNTIPTRSSHSTHSRGRGSNINSRGNSPGTQPRQPAANVPSSQFSTRNRFQLIDFTEEEGGEEVESTNTSSTKPPSTSMSDLADLKPPETSLIDFEDEESTENQSRVVQQNSSINSMLLDGHVSENSDSEDCVKVRTDKQAARPGKDQNDMPSSSIVSKFTALFEQTKTYRGTVNLEIQLGRVLIQNAESLTKQSFQLNNLVEELRSLKGFDLPLGAFTPAITTSNTDASKLLCLAGATNKAYHQTATWELTCNSRQHQEVNIIIDAVTDDATYINMKSECLGAIYIHCPQSAYDARVYMAGHTVEKDLSAIEGAQDLLDSLYIRSGDRALQLSTDRGRVCETPRLMAEETTLRVESVQLKTTNWHRLPDDRHFIKITRIYDLPIAREEDVQTKRANVINVAPKSENTLIKTQRFWYEASIGLVHTPTALQSCETLTVGEEVLWKPSEVMKEDEIVGFFKLAEGIVQKMNEIGAKNQGPGFSVSKEWKANRKAKEEAEKAKDSFW